MKVDDGFDDLFAVAQAPAEDKTADRTPKRPVAEDGEIVTVNFVFRDDKSCKVECADGEEFIVASASALNLSQGDRLVLFAGPTGEPSFESPRWWVTAEDEAAPAARASMGDTVVFHGRSVELEGDEPGVRGTALGMEAWVPRALMRWPEASSGYPLEHLLEESMPAVVRDPRCRPILLSLRLPPAGHARGGAASGVDLPLLVLRELAERGETTAQAVVEKLDGKALIRVLGAQYWVYPEYITLQEGGWRSDIRVGETRKVWFKVNLREGLAQFSMRGPEDPEWVECKRDHPLGSTVELTDCIPTREGLFGFVRHDGLCVPALAPIEELTHGLDKSQLPQPSEVATATVIGHDDQVGRLTISLRTAVADPWEYGTPTSGRLMSVLAVRAGRRSIAYWAIGHFGDVEADLRKKKVLGFARVDEVDPAARRVSFAGFEEQLEGRIAAVEDGVTWAEVEGGDRLRVKCVPLEVGQAVRIWPVGLAPLSGEGPQGLALPLVDGALVVEGEVTCLVPAGAQMDIGHEAFLPRSQADVKARATDLSGLVGQTLRVAVIQTTMRVTPSGSFLNLVVSQTSLLEEERLHRKTATLAKMEVGAKVIGTVKNITEYGVFINLGGLDGLLHITDMSWGRVNHPNELYKIGEEVEVVVLKFNPDTERVSLGAKQLTEDPWDHADRRYPVGSRVFGKVVSLTDYGAFLELEEGIDGLVHISEMSWTKRIKKPSTLLAVGDEVECVVLDVNVKDKRISLGIKQLAPNPWSLLPDKYPIGSTLRGPVRNITDFGVFVGIEDGVDGLVHVSDMSWTHRVTNPRERYSKRDEVEAVVLSIDPDAERFSVGINQLNPDPWEHIPQAYAEGRETGGPCVRRTDEVCFVELEPGVEVRVPSDALPEDLELGVGDWVSVMITEMDPDKKILSALVLGVSAPKAPAPPVDDTPPADDELDAPAPEEPEITPLPAAAASIPPPASIVPSRLLARLKSARSVEEAESDDDWIEDEEGDEVFAFDGEVLDEPDDDAHGPPNVDFELRAWLAGTHGALDLARTLSDAGHLALLDFVCTVAKLGEEWRSPWAPAADWARMAALIEAVGVPPGARSLDTVLRVVAGCPEELLGLEALAEALPAQWTLDNLQRVRIWLTSAGRGPEEDAAYAMDWLEALSAEASGQVERAFQTVNRMLGVRWDDALAQERRRLVEAFYVKLDRATEFADGLERDFGRPVRRGSFAAVVPVFDKLTGDRMALKHYLLKDVRIEEMKGALDLFEREADLYKRVGPHPNLAVWRERVSAGVLLFEWIEGDCLEPSKARVGGEDGWDVHRVVQLGAGIASWIRHVHEIHVPGFVHNDLAPRNLMIQKEVDGMDWVKVIDLGLSAAPEYRSVSSVIDSIGLERSEAYRAPEVITGHRGTPRSDMYSLGCILFELICGDLPARSAASTPPGDRPSIQGSLSPLGSRGWDVQAMIESMVQLDPERRPESWEEIQTALLGGLDD